MKFNIKSDLYNAVLNATIIIVLMLGVFARLYIAKIQAGAHSDDISLLSNAVSYSYFDLLTKPMQNFQCCPPLYIILLKFLYKNFGVNYVLIKGILGLFPSCLSLFLFPIIAYKVYRNKFAVLISSSILAFNWNSLVYAQRLKQYSTDILLTIFLIWLGYIFFLKPVTKKRIVFFTVICIICALLSYTSIIMSACLFFYYLFLFKKDNIKTKIVNFLIFIIPWLIIFIPYMILIGINNIHSPGQLSYWQYYSLSNFEQFKDMFFYLFGSADYYAQYKIHSFFPFVKNFWYIFIPVIIGVITIFIRKDRYLFCMLILPIIASQLLGIAYIYPIGGARVSLWLLPIFILLFVLPAMYIKFNKQQIVLSILSVFIIIYYLWIYYNPSIDSIRIYLNGYPFGRAIVYNELIDELKKTDITENDILVFQSFLDEKLTAFNIHKEFMENQKIDMSENLDDELCNQDTDECGYSKLLQIDGNMYFYLFKEFNDTESKYEWIKQNMNVIYEYETWYGNKFIKARKNNNEI